MANKIHSTTAFAMLCEQPRTAFTLQECRLPIPMEGEVLVKNLFTTICTSDLHTCMGRRSSPLPSVLGHEIIGEVVDLPKAAVVDYHGHVLKLGDRITWTIYAHDPSDERALRGIPQKSASLFKYGHVAAVDTSTTLSGGFASHCLLRRGTGLFRLPPELTLAEAAPLNCTHATVAGALRMAGSIKDKIVLISGAGMLGLSACAMAKSSGAKAVWAIDPIAERAAKARLFGASQSYSPETFFADQTLKADVLIETSGVPQAMEKGLASLNIGGIAIWVGAVYAQPNLSLNAEMIVRNILTIKGLHNYTPDDLAKAIQFLNAYHKIFPFQDLVGHRFPLAELDEAIRVADQNKYYRVGIFPNKK